MIYFDNAATTKPCKEAIETFNNSVWGNASSLHTLGINAEKAITQAKKDILNLLGDNDGNLIFTSSATESNNLALFGLYNTYKRNGNKIITTATEHPSVSKTLDAIDAEIIRISPRDNPDFEQGIINAVDDETIIVSVIAVNNETGYILDTARLYREIKAKNPKCIIHVDAVQAFLKTDVIGDTISISAHKLHGVKGIGGLYIKKGIRLKPIIHGGGQQNALRSGTEPVELITSFAAAVKAYKYDINYFRNLSDKLLQLLNDNIGVSNISLNSRFDSKNLPNIVNFSVKGIRSEILLHFLAEYNIYVSSGSACSRGKKSDILTHFGVKDNDIDSSIRVSFSPDNTADELVKFMEVLKLAVNRFKR